MRIPRRFTVEGRSPYENINFRTTTSEISNPDGTKVFRQEHVTVPEHWSQVASDVLAQKYFRRSGVPARLMPIAEDDVPEFLWRQTANTKELAELPENKTHHRRA